MKALAIGAMLAGAALALSNATTADQTPSYAHTLPAHAAPVVATPTLSPATLNAVVQQYCVVCHNDALLTGNVSLQSFDVEKAGDRSETAERMIRKLRAGMMPPPGIPRPGGDTLQTLVETLETTVDRAAKANPNVGVRRFQRLSQEEYERVVHDLLGLDVQASKWLPPDVLMGSFDNQSAAQNFSTTLLDSFLRAATEVSRLAIGNPDAASSTQKYIAPPEVSQGAWDHVDGAPFGTRGGMVVTHDFPADGDYVFQVVTTLGSGNVLLYEDVDVSIDGEPVALLKLEENGQHQIPAILTDPIHVTAGQHKVSATFVDKVDGPYDDRFSPPNWSGAGNAAGQYGVTGLTRLNELWITGPKSVAGVSDTESRKRIFTCHPTEAAQQRACAQSILRGLVAPAYRRPARPDDVADLMRFYDQGFARGGFEIGVRTGLQAILMSPEFLFRLEREPAGTAPGQEYRLSDIDLATRLSFFLWSTGPDQELIQAAAKGDLSKPAVLERQVKRMLKDPRAESLTTRFAHQWLRLQDVGAVWPQAYLYPNFSQQLADAMVRETELLFQHLIQDDRSLLELFNADYTFVNERLAKHYGIEGVVGEEFRRVQYPNDQRRGILGHGSVLQLTSMSDRTSPVLRGKWVMEVLMGTPPPPPPPNVPAFEATKDAAGARRLTTRERMEAHRASPVCNSCHRFIDPIGLALDNFDVVGQWRIRENMAPLDTRGVFYDGTPVTNPSELVNVLLKRPVPLVRNFTEHLLSYALGRPTAYYDQPAIRAIASGSEADGYKISSLIMGVVKSDAFQMRQAPTTAN